MKRQHILSLCIGIGLATASAVATAEISPDADKQKLWEFFKARYSSIATEDYVNGNYVFSEDLRSQWEEVEADFPPYEELVEKGEAEWNKAFSNGKHYASCFPGKEVSDIRGAHPYFDNERAEVITLELALNECRENNGEKPLKWQKGALANLSAYIAFEGRGNAIAIKVESKAAKQAYQNGKHLFYGKRGQFNMSCSDCHVYYAGKRARANVLSSVIGQVSHFPVYRKKWGNLGTLHRRYVGCQKNIRAKPYKPQSVEYRNLELFHSYMSNGLEWNGPQTRG